MRITFNTNTQYKPQAKQQAAFGGHGGVYVSKEAIKNGLNSKFLLPETSFFRDTSFLEFALYHIEKLFEKSNAANKEIKTIVAGCSTGEEAYTLAMLSSSPIKIKGSDISKDAIERARNGVFAMYEPISKEELSKKTNLSYEAIGALQDGHLISTTNNLTGIQKEERTLFNQYFQETFDKEGIKKCIPIAKEAGFLEDAKKRYFKVREEKKDICTFEDCDILDLSKIADKDSTDIVTFRNAMYHLTTNMSQEKERTLKDDSIVKEAYEKLADSVNSVIKKNGVFVIGTHDADFKSGAIAKEIFTKKGFKPVYTEKYGYVPIWERTV